MKKSTTLLLPSVLSAAMVGLVALPALQADPVKKATEVTFSGPTEIPGMVLPAGTYMIKVPDPYTHSDMVGFYDPSESHLYKLVRTVPAYRTVLNDKTVITFQERAAGAPPAVDRWFYPDDYYGRQFVYPAVEVRQVAEAAPLPPPPPIAAAPAPPPAVQEQESEQSQVTQSEVEQSQAEQPPAEQPQTEIAQNTPPPVQENPPVSSTPNQLPQTASDLPLLFASGAFLVLAGLGLRLVRS